jgi:DNA-binding Lrp family transcriptional regulator
MFFKREIITKWSIGAKIMAKKSVQQLHEDEMKVLHELQNNAKENIDKIAKHCGFSKQKVSRIIKKLEDHRIIWGYTAIADYRLSGRKEFILLVKRTNKALDKKIIDKIDSVDLEDLASPIGVHIQTSCFIHGKYDWMICFSAEDLFQARKFCEVLNTEFPGAIQQNDIQQVLYCVRQQYIFNPDRKQLRDLME